MSVWKALRLCICIARTDLDVHTYTGVGKSRFYSCEYAKHRVYSCIICVNNEGRQFVLFTFSAFCILRCLVCIVLVVVCVLLSSYVYLLYNVCITVFTLDAGLLARSQYSVGPATGHLDTGFSRFPCVYKQMLRWFPTFQVATTCFSCSPPDLNLLVTNFIFCIHVK